jgi:hypothetical protein
MQKQRSVTPFDGVGIGGDGDAADLDVPDISKAILMASETDRRSARSFNGVSGRWQACPCGRYDCRAARFVPD